MRQPTTLAAEDQTLLDLTFRDKWKTTQHECRAALLDAKRSKQPRTRSVATTRAWELLLGSFVESMLVQTTHKTKFVQHKGRTPQTREDGCSGAASEATAELGEQDC